MGHTFLIEGTVPSNPLVLCLLVFLLSSSPPPQVSFRFVIVDNSRSMLKRDGHRLVTLSSGEQRFEECTRWEEVGLLPSWFMPG